jgi:hypothetical protein
MNKHTDASGSLKHVNRSGESQGRLSQREKLLVKMIILLLGVSVAMVYSLDRGRAQRADKESSFDRQISENSRRMFEEGKQIFRYDSFGDEGYWTDKLKLHQAIQGSKFGGVGAGVSPKTALAVGLKVDMDALPADLVEKIKKGEVNLDDPATTLLLLNLSRSWA